jgi:hypothetical protein
MNCQEVMELMQRQLDYDLNAQEEELMWAHLEHCLDCAKMFERLQKLSAELTNLPKVEPAYSLVDAILPKLNEIDLQAAAVGCDSAIPLVKVESESGARLPRKLPWTHRFGSQISWKLAGGVVAAGLVIGFFIFGTNNPLSQNADGLLQPRTKAESKTAASAGASNKSAPAQDSKALTDSVRSDMKVMDQKGAKGDEKTDAKALSPEASANPAGKGSQGKEPNPTASPLASPASKALQPTQTETPLGSSDKNQEKSGVNPLATSEPTAQGVASSPTPTPASEPKEKSQATPADNDKAVGPEVPDNNPSNTAKIQMPPMSIMAVKPTELNSLDGKYVALIEQHKVIIRDTSANGLVFSSEHIWKESDEVTLLSWSEDNKLTYQVTSEALAQSFSIDLAAKTESVLSK